MADKTNIEWTDATVNFWWGCTKVGPGCDHCYAEKWDNRVGGAHWGVDVPRRKIESAGKILHRLDNGYAGWAADAECIRGNAKVFGLPVPNIGNRRRVFIQSMSDLFDLEVPLEWFAEAWDKIERCNWLELQLVTKRVSAVEKRLAQVGCTAWPKHAGLIITVVNQDEADRDIPRLLVLKAKLGIPWVGLSVEPMVGPIDLRHVAQADSGYINALSSSTGPNIDWVICGGESGPNARPMHPDWARSLRDQCAEAGVAFHFKQWGEWRAPAAFEDADRSHMIGPNDFRRIGKKRAGRLLDGLEHNQFPEPRT